jgi:hypothetical protein
MENATSTWTVYPQKQVRRWLKIHTFNRKICNILWFTFLSNFLFLDPVSSTNHPALQFEGAKPLQFVSWWNIFMQKSAFCLLAAVPPKPTWLQHNTSASLSVHPKKGISCHHRTNHYTRQKKKNFI